MKIIFLLAAALPVLTCALSRADASLATVFVPAASSNVTRVGAIGLLQPGTTYTLTATGIADLCTHCSARPLTFTADGLPTYAFASPYLGYPRDTDPQGGLGPGGVGRYHGLLLGTFLASPGAPADYFAIGRGTSFTVPAARTLYALINDSYYPDNGPGTGYTLTLSASVPEPATWALLIAGFALTGTAARRRRATAVAAKPTG